MSLEVTMPQMGESVVEGTVTKWLVQVGERVSEDQPLCEISTDKVDTEIPAPGAGVIARLIAAEGQTVPVGAPLALIEDAAAAATQVAGAALAPPRPPPARSAATPLAAVAPRTAPATAAVAASGPAPAGRADQSGAPAARPLAFAAGLRPGPRPQPSGEPPRRYSPVVMRMAEEHALDLSAVPGTGLGGRISKRDVERYLETLRPDARAPASAATGAPAAAAAAAAAGAPAPGPAPAAGPLFKPPVYQPREGDSVEPFSRRRRLIAAHMVFSKTHSPHVGTVAEVDLTRLTMLRDRHKDGFQSREGFALTLLPFAALATVRALREFPRMNAAVVGDAIVVRRDLHLGIAMDAEDGLLVPVVRQADTFTVVGLAREIERLRRKVQERTITADDLAGGSFTLSNPGREGNLYGFAIINQPQVGILRMGEVKKRPVVISVDGADAIVIRAMMYLALSYDHRVIDGVLGNRFLFRAARLLEAAEFEL